MGKMMVYDLIVVGGGAAGFFGAIQCAERMQKAKILILEKSAQVLSKVRISGGGRCNVTHACFDPQELVTYYPRGQKELLGPFHRFMCGDMMAWLDDHGVETKIESDGRVFPTSNKSSSIIDCFISLCEKYRIEIKTSTSVSEFHYRNDHWNIFSGAQQFSSKNLLFATGSSQAMWTKLERLGLKIVTPVPSLFTFNCQDKMIHGLPGLSVPNASVDIEGEQLSSSGPLLITHWGLSGPAILKLSAFGARRLHDLKYEFTIHVNWTEHTTEQVQLELADIKKKEGKRKVDTTPMFNLPKRLWSKICDSSGISGMKHGDLSKRQTQLLVENITKCKLDIKGKSTFKDEFVTAGGVDTKEINFKTMESKNHPGLYLAGEVLNIDAVTGGFNFQAAWTGAHVAAEAICTSLRED